MTAPLPCGWTPDPIRVIHRRLHDAQDRYVAELADAHGDPDVIAAAERTFAAATDAIEADLDRATQESR